jgi:phosphoenolpyruvate carboxykinase (GTP)
MMETINKNTIYTNVLLRPDGGVWWEGADDPAPESGIDWQGRPWNPSMVDREGKPMKGAHPNSRFTTPMSQCPSASFRVDQHHGVPISAIIFGGRRQHLTPLVYESFSWPHGVFVGSAAASELTAAQFGKLGQVRYDPMAMLPFCGYNMADYFKHWLEMGKRMSRPPKIFHVNWFRTDEQGKFLWPGYRENLRVLEWILQRVNNNIEAQKSPIGYLPKPTDTDLTGLDTTVETMEKLLHIDKKEWLDELKRIKKFFKQFKKDLPEELWQEYQALYARLKDSHATQ